MVSCLYPQQDGILVLHKPRGLSSGQCVARIKRLGQKKIGHGGTLDPMAEGVLLVLLGQATKLSDYLLSGGEKIYSGVAELGRTTDTWDDEGETVATESFAHVTEEDVANIIASWVGESEQEVPAYSAAKFQGQSLYKLARQGKETPIKRKLIKISRADLLSCKLPLVHFRVHCSSGTYIRSLAHSLGIRLGCGAVLTELIREHSHPYSLENAHTLDAVQEQPERLAEWIIPLEQALPHWPKLRLSSAQEALVRNGTALPYMAENMAGVAFSEGMKAMFLAENGTALALAQTATLADGKECWTVLRGLWRA